MNCLSFICIIYIITDSEGSAVLTRYGFYKDMAREKRIGSRRVFGGEEATLKDAPLVCALTDRYLVSVCSCSVIRPHWALTAAHCVSALLVYVSYNSAGVAQPSGEGDIATVHYRYTHPDFKVTEVKSSAGPDVSTLHNDLGLVRTRTPMFLLATPVPIIEAGSVLDPLISVQMYSPEELIGKHVEMLGFGRTPEPGVSRLMKVALTVLRCARSEWWRCACAGGRVAGVCAGDSGGPVMYRGVQVGITSLGPLDCDLKSAPTNSVSVFTILRHYRDVINDTILRADTDLQRRLRRRNLATQHTILDNAISCVFLLLCFVE